MKALEISLFLANARFFSHTIFENFCVSCVKILFKTVELPKNHAPKCLLASSAKALAAVLKYLFFFLIKYTVREEKRVSGAYRQSEVL